ncbi:hypothetical protein [Ferrimicrobium sp.]|jgi:hypothetical protein|uniref:hypothetical protein n=1 Tax=Ferrimicrobium sp. TaxID=2926050 RepID=UPI0027E5B837|nr:hypothetical protein [Ferrimicrobium sp.]
MLDQTAADTIAFPLPMLLEESCRVIALVREDLAHPKCQFIWKTSTFGRAFSLAALSHECLILDQLNIGCHLDFPTMTMGLLSRHHLETWLTGMYLLEGGSEALELFLGESHRASTTLHKKIQELQDQGQALDIPNPPCVDNTWEPKRWNFEFVANALEQLSEETGRIKGVLETYHRVYRALSGLHGGHPTHRVLDSYIDTTHGFAHILRESQAPPLHRELLQWSIMLTSTHALLALGDVGLPTATFAEVIQSLTPTDRT